MITTNDGPFGDCQICNCGKVHMVWYYVTRNKKRQHDSYDIVYVAYKTKLKGGYFFGFPKFD